ncbi:initiator tRNA phosphoribosyl transferase [Exidia glandulosa HHB12029]|uniref:Initiator tRNA phosphoribosyl transferase n=1 Tax=Exidia glandulosa HHB12029 TaxID=1314781 RepID=A0A165FGM8_EXIGL|nr:initiator tRNA phosphoribosyl transferase [Exidia glandulosa HHB12029]
MDRERSSTEALRRENLDIYNRLRSIAHDARFVSSVADAYPHYPLLPNLRCGAWYTDPAKATSEPVYFKSTDGHHGQWAFNLRRANLHLLPLIAQHGGVILVDSTRRGKRIPDALAKTVPMWCAVVNAAVARRHDTMWNEDGGAKLFTPPSSVSSSEHAQMDALVQEFARTLLDSQYTLPALAKPLRPFWITPSTSVLPLVGNVADELDFYPVLCVSASKAVPNSEGMEREAGWVYVQGSGDDHELWMLCGLTPELYWRHTEMLLSTPRTDLPELIRSLVSKCSSPNLPTSAVQQDASSVRRVHGRLWVSSLAGAESLPEGMAVLRLGIDSAPTETSLSIPLPDGAGKKGQFHFMNTVLPLGITFVSDQLARGRNVCIACADGKDASVGVAAATLVIYFDDDGHYIGTRPQAAMSTPTKESIRRRLQWVLESRPGANPARTTLKRVNEFLMSPSTRAAHPARPSTTATNSTER